MYKPVGCYIFWSYTASEIIQYRHNSTSFNTSSPAIPSVQTALRGCFEIIFGIKSADAVGALSILQLKSEVIDVCAIVRRDRYQRKGKRHRPHLDIRNGAVQLALLVGCGFVGIILICGIADYTCAV